MKVLDLLIDESKWTQGAFARDKDGDGLNFVPSKVATCWCLAGALFQCYTDMEVRNIENMIREKVKLPTSIWNDKPERTFAEVRALITELDI